MKRGKPTKSTTVRVCAFNGPSADSLTVPMRMINVNEAGAMAMTPPTPRPTQPTSRAFTAYTRRCDRRPGDIR